MCQSCVDDGLLSQETYDKINSFLEQYPDAEFGPAHLVLSDSNVFDHHLLFCLGVAKAALSGNPIDLYPAEGKDGPRTVDSYPDHSQEEIRATVDFLNELLEIPEEAR